MTRAELISIIVPTKDSARTIEACLTALRHQTYTSVELIVVDNDSRDGTVAAARGIADIVLSKGPERSAQRNAGAAAASGTILIFVDSDMEMSATVVQEVADLFCSGPEVVAAVIPEISKGAGFWARCKALEKRLYLGDSSVEAARAFRRSSFESIGGYDESIHGGGEDWDLPERIRAAGGIIERIDANVVHLEGRLRLREDLRKKLYYGRTFARYVKKHPRLGFRKVFRFSVFKNWILLKDEPIVAVGFVAMKLLEGLAVAFGALAAVVSPHPAERSLFRKPPC